MPSASAKAGGIFIPARKKGGGNIVKGIKHKSHAGTLEEK